MVQEPERPSPYRPEPGEPDLDAGTPNGFVVVVLESDEGFDPDHTLRESIRRRRDPLDRLLRELDRLGDPITMPFVDRASLERVRRLEERARIGNPGRHSRSLTRFWRIDVAGRSDSDLAEVVRRLSEVPGVEFAYPEARVIPASSSVVTDTPTVMTTQGHLDAPAAGINARFAWTRRGGRGQDVGLVDIEEAWRLTHPALAVHAPEVLLDAVRKNRDGLDGFVGDHGTSALGIVAATGKGVTVAGVAPSIRFLRACSHYDVVANKELHVGLAVVQAADVLEPGDVILLEVERGSTRGALPTEIDPADYSAIKAATDAGIVVVEAAGNGSRDLDVWQHPTEMPPRRMQRGVAGSDSGAVMVGSCIDTLFDGGHQRRGDSNFGARVDCFAWGQQVATATATATAAGYTSGFAGTSAAAAIIAGAAVVTQGMHLAANGVPPLSAARVREVLSAPSGTPQMPDTDPQRIGFMPDLEWVAGEVGALPENVIG